MVQLNLNLHKFIFINLIRQSRMLECWDSGMHKSHLSPSANIHAKACMFLVKGLKLFIMVLVHLIAINLHAFEVPENIIMNQFSGIPLRQKKQNPFYDIYNPVRMPHEIHLTMDCEICHHKWEAQMDSPGKCTSTGCHDVLNRSLNVKKIKTASFAYHSLNNSKSCIGCHHLRKIGGETSGPITCSKCHTSD